MDESQSSLIPPALPHLIYLAGPDEHHFFGKPRPQEPAGLNAIYQITARPVMEAFEKGLTSPQKI